MESTQKQPLSTRHTRRLLVVITYLAYLCLVFSWEPARALGSWGWLLVVLVFGFTTLMGYAMLSVSQYGLMSNSNPQALDERQEGVRNRAFRYAYGLLGVLVMVAALYGYIATDSGSLWLPQSSNELQAVFWGVMLLVTTLPAATLAWTEPEPIQ